MPRAITGWKILIGIVAIGIILIVALPVTGTLGTMVVVKVSGWTYKAKEAKIKQDLRAIISAARLFQASEGRYPNSLEELRSGQTSDGKESGLQLSSTKDPWSNEYTYRLDSMGKPYAECLGKDGIPGGEGDNKDYRYPEAGQ